MSGIVGSILSAAGYAFVTYMAKMKKGEAFNELKFLRTLGIGALLGGIAYSAGYDLTMENYRQYLAANMGTIVFVEQIIKLIYRAIRR